MTTPDEPEPLDATAYGLAASIARATDSPATGRLRETVVGVWQATDGSWRVVTDLAAYRLPDNDSPSVAVDDVLAPGTPVGRAWVLDKLDLRTDSDYITTPAEFMQGVTFGDITWYAERVPLVVDTVDDRTRVRFRIGGSEDDVDAVWTASMANGIENDWTLAQALDTRTSPTGEPGPESLPTKISPMEFLARELLAGCAYRLVIQSDRLGANSGTVAQIAAAARRAAGSYTAVFVWEGSEPALAPVDPT